MPQGTICRTSKREIGAFVRVVLLQVLMYLPIVETQFDELFGEDDAFDTPRIKHKDDGNVWFLVYDEEIDEEAELDDYNPVLEIDTGISSILFKSLRQTIIDKISFDAMCGSRPAGCDTSNLSHDFDYEDTLEGYADAYDDSFNLITGFFRPYAGTTLINETLETFYNNPRFQDKNERDLFYKLFSTLETFRICWMETQFNSFNCIDVETYDV